MTDSLDTISDDGSLNALHVSFEIAGQGIFGRVGRNTIQAKRAEGFVDVVSAGDVVRVALGPSGMLEASEKLKRRYTDPLQEGDLSFNLPYDFGQVGWQWSGGQPYEVYAALFALPPSHIVTDDGDGRRVAFGNLNANVVTSTAYYGHQAFWDITYMGAQQIAQALDLNPLTPAPAPLELTLMSAHFPGEPTAPVLPSQVVNLTYRAESLTWPLPPAWAAAFADGSAGSIRFAPASSAQGLTLIASGLDGSLNLHR